MPRFATAFGLLLGPGFFTFVTFVGYYLVLGWCVLVADPIRAGILMAALGSARALPVVLAPLGAWVMGLDYTTDIAVAINRRLRALDSRLTWLRASTLFAASGVTLATALNQLSIW